jgi:hypothetical protein
VRFAAERAEDAVLCAWTEVRVERQRGVAGRGDDDSKRWVDGTRVGAGGDQDKPRYDRLFHWLDNRVAAYDLGEGGVGSPCLRTATRCCSMFVPVVLAT